MGMIGNLARISEDVRLSLHKSPNEIEDLLYAEDSIPEADKMDLDKAWHALHFLFTGSDLEGDFPGGFLVSCGEPVGDVDVGYGPARSFTAGEVKNIHAFLSTIGPEELKRKFDPKKMVELNIYPSIWDNLEDPEKQLEYIVENFELLTDFTKETALRNMAMLTYIN